MKKAVSLFTALLLIAPLCGQQGVLTLSAPESGTKVHVARDRITFLPGYRYESAGSNTMRASINDQLMLPVEYQSGLPSNNRQLNTSYAVGATAGAADVTPTGAAVYQIPVSMPAGTAGVQPNISIVYNSQTGNGLLGYGWNLAGISSISRCGKTFYHDSKTDGVRLDNSDNLMLDGQRLMLVSGANLTNGAEYRTEVETYSVIKYKTIGSKLCFEVKNKDGWTLEYGTTGDSYIEASGSSTALCWLLARVTDPSGNWMTYSYTEDNATGEFRLKRIDYTGNTGVQPYSAVEFFYETRTDQQTGYIAGKALKQTVLLKRLRTSSSNTTFREYRFNYYFDGMYSKLTEVEEYGHGGARYNSTIISPDNTTFAGEDRYILTTARGFGTSMYADFDGDGKTDFISYIAKSSYTSSDVATLYIASDNNGLSFSKTTATIPLLPGFQRFLVNDMDGDGRCDVIMVYKEGNTYYYRIYLYTNWNGGQFYINRLYSSSGGECLVGDFDGDGRGDIFFRAELKAFSYIGEEIASGGISAADGGIDYQSYFPNKHYVMNFTGSGKTNLLTVSNSSCKVFELNGDIFNEIKGFNTTNVKNSDEIVPGDYNGDGLTDLLIVRNKLYYYILFSTGKGFVRTDLPNLKLHSLILSGDINRDGKTDIVQTYITVDEYENNAMMYTRIGIFNGSGFSFETHEFSNISARDVPIDDCMYDPNTRKYLHQPARPYFALEDFNGDGRCELIYDGDLPHIREKKKLSYKSFNDPLRLQTGSITDGLNRRTEFSYRPMTYTDICSGATGVYDFPISTARFPICLTESVSSTSNVHTDKTTYRYTGTRIHRRGKGFLGFEKITASNDHKNRKTTTEYGYHPAYFHVYPKKQQVETCAGTPRGLSTVEYTYMHIPIGSGGFFPYLWNQKTTDHLSGLVVTSDFQYRLPDHGNPVKITETRGSMVTETTLTWAAKGGSIYKNRLIESTVIRSGLQGTFTHTTGMDYDSKGRLTSQTAMKGTDKAVTTLYSNFDVFGSPQTVTTTATGCPSITVTTAYDRYGRPVSRTDATGTATSVYDYFGRITSQTNIDGSTVKYRYDGFGNLTGETNPTGTVTHSLVWNIAANQVYRTVRKEDGTPTQMAWYDAVGREVMARVKGFSGDIYSAKEYDYYTGRIIRTRLPGYGSASNLSTEYAYDAYGRTVSETSISGTAEYSYNGLSTIVNYPDGTFKTTKLNTSGLVESVTDGGGTVSYSYNSLGDPVTINTAGLATTMEYDSRGYRTALKDPNMSNAVHYSYDAYGMLRSQTNARGQTTLFTFDAAGRPVTEQLPNNEGTYSYSYVTSGNGKGELQSISKGGTPVRSISYNTLGLPQTVTENIDGTAYTTTYTYDGKGRLLEKVSPSGFKLLHIYNGDGYLTNLRDGSSNANIWTANAINALGQVTQSTAGNGLVRNSTFSPADLSLESITLKNGASVIDNVIYDFDAASGNLLQRNDVTGSRNEQFGYDALNRLTSVKLNTASPQAIAYAANGNITSKYDAGTYLYSNNNHAVSNIQNIPPPGSVVQERFLTYIEHTSYNRVSKIKNSSHSTLTFSYGPDKQRNKSVYMNLNNSAFATKYYVGSYEKEIMVNNSVKEYDYIYTPEGLGAIVTKTGGSYSISYVHTDHLGSPRVISNGAKAVLARYSYDAWGKRTLVAGTNITNRGFTGHEHIDEFGLINMNARLYDPTSGRFLSPDPYVQAPDFSQSFNRYSYALNNPLSFTDPSGEFIWSILTSIFDLIGTALFKGGLDPTSDAARQNAWQNYDPTAPWSNTNKAWQIDMGLFKGDPQQILSRFTWELPQTLFGYIGSGVQNLFGGVRSVTHYDGATVVETYGSNWGAVTLGSYIMGNRGITADPNTPLFQHEYGHYIQSQKVGWGYLVSHGIPSLRSAANNESGSHKYFWTEQDANKKAYEYFYSKMGRDLKWNFSSHPIDANWVSTIQSKYNKNSAQSHYWPTYTTRYTPMVNYPFNYFNLGYTYQGLNDYWNNKYRKQPSHKSLVELLSIY